MSTSPEGVEICSAVDTVAPAMMEDSSALTKPRRPPTSSAILIARQFYLGREVRVFLLVFI